MVNLDFSSVPSREPLEPGIYGLTIEKLEETTSSTGNPMWKVTYSVDEDAQGNAVEGQRKLWDNFVLVDKALWKLKELFDALGIDTSDVVEMDPQELVGLSIQARVVHDEYNGETVNRVKKIIKPAW